VNCSSSRAAADPTVVLGRVDYAEFVNAPARGTALGNRSQGATLVLEGEPPRVRLLLDPVRLGHVFHNILNNACDAMPEGGKISCAFARNPRRWSPSSKIRGPGSPRRLPRAVRSVRHLRQIPRRTGSWVSSICKRIIQDHSGRPITGQQRRASISAVTSTSRRPVRIRRHRGSFR
jgi:signal transduction histidine kinase